MISGFTLYEEILSEADAAAVVAAVRSDGLQPECGRLVARYHDLGALPGANQSWFGSQSRAGFPEYARQVLDAVRAHTPARGPSYRLIVNDYAAAEVATAHVDRVFPGVRDVVVAVSLGSARTMRLTKDKQVQDVLLPPRSAVIFSGESRYQWKHQILPGSASRISLIYRVLENEA